MEGEKKRKGFLFQSRASMTDIRRRRGRIERCHRGEREQWSLSRRSRAHRRKGKGESERVNRSCGRRRERVKNEEGN